VWLFRNHLSRLDGAGFPLTLPQELSRAARQTLRKGQKGGGAQNTSHSPAHTGTQHGQRPGSATQGVTTDQAVVAVPETPTQRLSFRARAVTQPAQMTFILAAADAHFCGHTAGAEDRGRTLAQDLLSDCSSPGLSFLLSKAEGPSRAKCPPNSAYIQQSQESFIPSHGLPCHLPEYRSDMAVQSAMGVLLREWWYLLGPGAAGFLGRPGPWPHGWQYSEPPANAAIAPWRGHSGTRSAGPAEASTHALPLASPLGLACLPCSQGEGWCRAADQPAVRREGP
jgi:hypothetical protein